MSRKLIKVVMVTAPENFDPMNMEQVEKLFQEAMNEEQEDRNVVRRTRRSRKLKPSQTRWRGR